MKRLGVKIIKQRLRNRKDPKKLERISKTMIEQMCARKERIKSKYSKQIKQLNATQATALKLEVERVENERKAISLSLSDICDRFARIEHDIKSSIKLSQSTKRSAVGIGSVDGYGHGQVQVDRPQQPLQIKRNLPCSMMNSNDALHIVGGEDDIDRLFAENEHFRSIILDDIPDGGNRAEFTLPRIGATTL